MFDITDPYNYTILGMYQERIEDDIDSLYRRSMKTPIYREEIENLLAQYGIDFCQLPSWLKWKIGDIKIN